jgi:transcriptional regulator with XRE-family HTH domain
MRRRRTLARGFGGVVREERLKAQLSQERLAFRAGIHPTYLSRLERGEKSPTLDVVDSLARALHVKPHVLIAAAESESA